ncbi:hypothetical protein [Spiroplasma alleghenense]|uniref:Uncharacterized protein n=1 Tax=Spiroplasma alleghenense TaxID=216931 RepID=A0A345Z2I0_9MOLU|nr:hypothetical protein [Spiroplasma alleghenense]AXK50809.1 hypothetical protein SALLE_v1c01330 [Spiroplasma alleghenense]
MKASYYRSAWVLNLISLILTLCSVGFFGLFGIFYLITMSTNGEIRVAGIVILLMFTIFLILGCLTMPIIAMVIISKAKKNGYKDRHTALGICLLIFGGLFGLIAGILILIADSDSNQANSIYNDAPPIERSMNPSEPESII